MNEPTEVSPTPAPSMGLGARLMNILAAPGEVFEAIRPAPHQVSNWFVPVAVYMIVVMIGAGVVMMQPIFKQQIMEMQAKAIDQQVEKGKIPPEQAEQIKRQMESLPAWVFQIGVVVQGLVVGGFGWLWWSFVLWLLGAKLLKGGFSFVKAMEASGLVHVILILGVIIQTLLALAMGNLFARPAPSMFVQEIDVTNRLHLSLAALNLIYLWFTAVVAVAASRLGNLPLGRCLMVFFGCWILIRVLLIGLGGSFGGMVL